MKAAPNIPAFETAAGSIPEREWEAFIPARPEGPPAAGSVRAYFKSLGLGLSILALIFSLMLHGSIIYLMFFGLPSWLKLLPSCFSGCLGCSEPCRANDTLSGRIAGLPQCMSNCLQYSGIQRQSLEVRPEQTMMVEIIELPPPPPPPAETAGPAPPAQPAPDLYQLKGNSRDANDEGASADNSTSSGGRDMEMAALAPDAAAPPALPEPDPEALALEKKSPPPPVEVPEIKRNEPVARAQAPPKPGTMPLHEIITRSLGRDAAGRMLGSAGGTQDDPAMRNYLNNTRVRLDRNWRALGRRPQGYQASYEMVIEPNGRISDFRLVRSSGNADFNRSVEAAIRKTSPLPPLPSSYGPRSLRVAFTFSDRRK